MQYANGVTELNGYTVCSKYILISLKHGHASLEKSFTNFRN